ncbi:hypothetical protein L484_025887 [Morus notabilis]|uniref:Uncharacterized protein n=1 Tax=Morus notabilis TaxID=981085 RepID=W9R2K5_9ROSA|nr:hypothetical protein L484_025887 [Morus notabilis]
MRDLPVEEPLGGLWKTHSEAENRPSSNGETLSPTFTTVTGIQPHHHPKKPTFKRSKSSEELNHRTKGKPKNVAQRFVTQPLIRVRSGQTELPHHTPLPPTRSP